MDLSDLIYSFRVRLLLVLAALLVATLGLQYYLNLRAKERFNHLIAEQEQALAASTALALESISSKQYLDELYKERNLTLLEKQSGRVRNILVVNKQGEVLDSLDQRYGPKLLPDGTTTQYVNISDVPLAPLIDAGQPIDDIKQMLRSAPHASEQPVAGRPRAFPIRFETSITTAGATEPTQITEPLYIIIVLGSAPLADSLWEAAWRLLPTLAVLLVATLITAFLVWRFTRPITELSEAAHRVAAGHFDFRVPAAARRDEMGALATVFNEMIARLGGMRELEARLHNVERSAVVGRLASAIAHEIRNPLNYINLTLDHLRTTLAPEDERKRALFVRLTNQLKAEVARINARISEFLSYTRPRKLELRPLDLRAAIEDALRLVEVQAAESSIETRVEQVGAIPLVEGDAESLRSVFTNLIINGLQAIDGEGGRLTITLREEEGRVRADVTDTGRGIAPENISQVFEPYFSTKETGTGLGLAIVKKAIDDHGGAISVTSKPGAGTTFTVTFLAAEKAPAT